MKGFLEETLTRKCNGEEVECGITGVETVRAVRRRRCIRVTRTQEDTRRERRFTCEGTRYCDYEHNH